MKKLTLIAVAVAIAVSGCADMSPTQRGTAQGAGLGALGGAVIGAMAGDRKDAATGAVIGAAAGAIAGNVWSKRMESQKRAMEEATQGTGVQVTQTADNRLKLEIPSDISFDTNRADIKPNFRPVLDRFATSLNENPVTNVTIIGHTDSTGSDAINDPLSRNRAANARDYLSARGVSSARFTVEGRGSRQPVADNATVAGRAQNRRVEIFVAEPAPQTQAPAR
ncbi:OmpA family protein [Noviherbaspirillum sedimenti]|uniref:OmpA family protein n=1 Tax=Noviherbaspirillum sedimenti TaxID=2320865 RepID=A0A3A3FZP0_9BURK|nr:OmpA family protein [Noviherbaspirillum sedimenti]RJG01141.1 OmpA family protein [Noviherbaspirillum sedimenti]